jgi:large subunit ribosomal protein L25
MAEQVKLVAEVRDLSGSSVSRRLRRTGRVPAVVYGSGVGATRLHVDGLELYHALHTPAGINVLIRLQIDGDEHLTLPRDVQRHPVRGDLFHVDFVALDRDQLIRVEVPVHLEGAEDVASPGVVQHVLHTVPIRVRPLDIPDSFALHVADMAIGDVLRVEDLQLPEGAEFDIETDRTIVTVSAPTVLEAPEELEVPDTIQDIMQGLEGEELSADELEQRIAAAQEAAEAGEQGPEGPGHDVPGGG